MSESESPRKIIPLRPRRQQPRPIGTHVSHYNGATTIGRLWPSGHTPAACPYCPGRPCSMGPYRMCLVTTPGLIPDHEAPLFRLPPPSSDRSASGTGG